MKKTTQKRSPFGSLICATFGHDYTVSKKVTNNINEYVCCNCKKEVTDTLNGTIVPLTPKGKSVNDCVASFYMRRRQRLAIG